MRSFTQSLFTSSCYQRFRRQKSCCCCGLETPLVLSGARMSPPRLTSQCIHHHSWDEGIVHWVPHPWKTRLATARHTMNQAPVCINIE